MMRAERADIVFSIEFFDHLPFAAPNARKAFRQKTLPSMIERKPFDLRENGMLLSSDGQMGHSREQPFADLLSVDLHGFGASFAALAFCSR